MSVRAAGSPYTVPMADLEDSARVPLAEQGEAQSPVRGLWPGDGTLPALDGGGGGNGNGIGDGDGD